MHVGCSSTPEGMIQRRIDIVMSHSMAANCMLMFCFIVYIFRNNKKCANVSIPFIVWLELFLLTSVFNFEVALHALNRTHTFATRKNDCLSDCFSAN